MSAAVGTGASTTRNGEVLQNTFDPEGLRLLEQIAAALPDELTFDKLLDRVFKAKEVRSTGARQSSVTAAASNTLLLRANSARLGATIYNDSDKIFYVKLGETATTSSFTVVLAKEDANGVGGYYELPYGYVGPVYGIWDTGPTGSARITELV